MFWFFGREACGILAPRPGIEPAPPALEGEVPTTGPPGKSLVIYFMYSSVYMSIPISQFIPLPISPLVTISLFSISVTLFLFCK